MQPFSGLCALVLFKITFKFMLRDWIGPHPRISVRSHVLWTWYVKTHRFRITLPICPRCAGISFNVLNMNDDQFCTAKLYGFCNFILNMDYGWNPDHEWLITVEHKVPCRTPMYCVSYLDCKCYFQIVFYGYLAVELMTVISYNVSIWTISSMYVSVNTLDKSLLDVSDSSAKNFEVTRM